ncbi:MAG: hypothetical protein Phog2KO_27880 [Phototrophicaceae bacterium]
MEEKKKKLTGQQGELMRALEISVDDLMANDEGYITEAQRESLPKRQGYQLLPYKIMGGAFAGFALIFPVLFMLIDDAPPEMLFMSLFFLAIASIAGGFGLYQQRRLKNDLASNEFQTVQGIAVVNIGENEAHLEINGLKLNASPDVLRRIRHLDPYIVHYLPNSKVILSMENLSDDDNIRQDERSSRLQDDDSADESSVNYEKLQENRQKFT